MKKVIINLFLGFILFNNATAQNHKLNKFEGTWQWKSNDSTFTIALKKVKLNGKKFDAAMPDTTVDMIIGWQELKVKGVAIKSSMQGKSNTFNYVKKDYSMWGTENNLNQNGTAILLEFYNFGFSNRIIWFTPSANGATAEWKCGKIKDISPGIVTMAKIE